jgi:hypothetical protein
MITGTSSFPACWWAVRPGEGGGPVEEGPRLSDQLEAWLGAERRKTIGDLVETFGPGSFAVLFVILLAIPSLPLPTGGVSHVVEVLAMLLALELVAGRSEVWIPSRWQDRELKGLAGPRFSAALLRRIRWLERRSRPRLARAIDNRLARVLFGATVFGLSLTAFLAPPFSGLDTLPALGAVVLSLGVLLRDVVVATVGAVIGALGVVVVVGLGRAILQLL